MRVQIVSATMSLVFLAVCSEAPLRACDHGHGAEAGLAPSTWATFEGVIHGCSSTGPDETRLTLGNTLHFKSGSKGNLWVTDHPLLNGLDRNIVDANINVNVDGASAGRMAWPYSRPRASPGGGTSGVNECTPGFPGVRRVSATVRGEA